MRIFLCKYSLWETGGVSESKTHKNVGGWVPLELLSLRSAHSEPLAICYLHSGFPALALDPMDVSALIGCDSL